MDKFTFSVWDVFNFMMSGLLAFTALCVHLSLNASIDLIGAIKDLQGAEAASLAVAVPLLSILIGMTIEPFSNYFDRYFLSPCFRLATSNKESEVNKELAALVVLAKKEMPDALSRSFENPFFFCKEYLDRKKINNTYEIFLARFGFYRNCSLIFFALAIGTAYLQRLSGTSLTAVCLLTAAALTFKARSTQFYEYQGPAVLRAFLIDRHMIKGNE